MNVQRLKMDFAYIILNVFIRHIPSWSIRKNLYKLFGIHIEQGVRIGINTIIVSPQNIRIGKNTVVNENCYLDGRGGLYIGDDCSISFGTVMITASHLANSNEFAYYEKSIEIENNVWIGAHAIILDGTRVENFAIIGAGAVIKGLAEEKGVYVGNPAKKLKSRTISENYHLNYKAFCR